MVGTQKDRERKSVCGENKGPIKEDYQTEKEVVANDNFEMEKRLCLLIWK